MQRILQCGERHGATVQSHRNLKARQLSIRIAVLHELPHGVRRLGQAQRSAGRTQTVIHGMRVSRVHEYSQQTFADKLNMARAKEVNCIARTAIKLAHELTQFPSIQSLSHRSIVGHVYEQDGRMLNVLITVRIGCIRPTVAQLFG